MRALISILVVMSLVAVANAQSDPQPQPAAPSYAAPPAQTPQQPYPYPQPQPQPYPQYGYGPRPVLQYQLTLDEQYLLDRGFISDGEWIAGGLVNVFFGFGLGQAVQGRWSERGYIFTLGQGASSVAMFYGVTRLLTDCVDTPQSTCDNSHGFGIMMAGLIGYTVFYVWGAVDAFVVPPSHNRKLKELRMRLGMPVPAYARVAPYVTSPRGDSGGAIGGLTVRF